MRYVPVFLALLAVGVVSCDDIQEPTQPLSHPNPQLPLFQQADTTFAVRRADRLKVNQLEGQVSITAWDRDEMRVVADYDEDEGHLDIRQSGSTVHVSAKDERGKPVYAEFEIAVPRGMALEITGVSLEVAVEGSAGDVSVSTAEGNILLAGGSGNVTLNTGKGAVYVANASGNIKLETTEGDVSVANSSGVLAVSAEDGAALLDGIESDYVAVNVTEGEISYYGTIADGGRYMLSTDDGDLYMRVPVGTNAQFSVTLPDGLFEVDFPVTIEGDETQFYFTLGTGTALVELSSFDGDVRLTQP